MKYQELLEQEKQEYEKQDQYQQFKHDLKLKEYSERRDKTHRVKDDNLDLIAKK